MAETGYNIRLSNVRVQAMTAASDFSLLTLCMALVCKGPVAGEGHISALGPGAGSRPCDTIASSLQQRRGCPDTQIPDLVAGDLKRRFEPASSVG